MVLSKIETSRAFLVMCFLQVTEQLKRCLKYLFSRISQTIFYFRLYILTKRHLSYTFTFVHTLCFGRPQDLFCLVSEGIYSWFCLSRQNSTSQNSWVKIAKNSTYPLCFVPRNKLLCTGIHCFLCFIFFSCHF